MSWKNDLSQELSNAYGSSYDRISDRAELQNLDTINKNRAELDVWFDIVELAEKSSKSINGNGDKRY